MRALRNVVDEYDREGRWPALGQRLLRVLLLNEPGDLIGWRSPPPSRTLRDWRSKCLPHGNRMTNWRKKSSNTSWKRLKKRP